MFKDLLLPMFKDLLPLFGALVGVGLGWLLNSRTARRAKLMDLKIENYAEWAAGMEKSLHDYARQPKESANPYRTPLCEKRLLIIEDSVARKLIREIHDSIPPLESAQYAELHAIAHSDPEWEWLPFREKMDKLLEHVRRKLY